MSGASLLDATKELGVRFRLVGLLPMTVLGTFVLALLWSGAPGRAPDPDRIAAHVKSLSGWQGALLALALVVVALLTEPLQLSLTRLLEGYWGESRAGRLIGGPGRALQRRRRLRLERTQQRRTGARERSLGQREAAARRLRRYPAPTALLPTALGNVLRAAEVRAGSRYALDALAVWPRLYPLLPAPMTAILDDLRNQLDLAARFCAVFVLAAGVSVGLLVGHGWWLLLSAGSVFLAWLSYRAAVAAALAYGEAIEAAFDLHRFDLLRALHLPLPDNLAAELRANEELSRFLRHATEEVYRLRKTGKGINVTYEHELQDPRDRA